MAIVILSVFMSTKDSASSSIDEGSLHLNIRASDGLRLWFRASFYHFIASLITLSWFLIYFEFDRYYRTPFSKLLPTNRKLSFNM